MPYIPQDERNDLNPLIDELASKIRSYHDGASNTSIAGILNYVMTRLVLEAGQPTRYHDIALLTGVIENVKQEFYRQWAAPYEDEKIKENGPVY